MTNLVNTLHERTNEVLKGGGDKTVKKHLSRGKLLVRDRINKLLDNNTAFLELSALAAYDMYDGQINSASLITGIGRIHG